LTLSSPLLLYDGICGLCNRLVRFILRRDLAGIFRFASLQSPLAGRILVRYGANPADLDTVYVVVNHNESDESLLARSDAVLFVLREMGGIWGAVAFLLRPVPRRLRDGAYRIVARHRYRIFGRYDACLLPSEETRGRFLDV
jgi:predicted DCC family thiol-disulfide oxidoreductase YuxK